MGLTGDLLMCNLWPVCPCRAQVCTESHQARDVGVFGLSGKMTEKTGQIQSVNLDVVGFEAIGLVMMWRASKAAHTALLA